MKLVVLGGGGVRTPILLKGILNTYKDIGLHKVVLFDTDESRLELMKRVISSLCRRYEHPEIEFCSDRKGLFKDTDFVFSAIRVGGDHARVLDERIALNHGFIGQETVGPGGFAMALRTIPVAIDYANQMLEESPSAWFINFTNPSGMVTQALLRSTTAKVIGICDGPTSIVKSAAKVLGKPYEMLQVKYVGLNHLGWVTDIVHEGNSLLSACIERYDEFVEFSDEPVYGSFRDYVQQFGVIPNEYLYFYYFAQEVYNNMSSALKTRAEEIRDFNKILFSELKNISDEKVLKTYEEYIDKRRGSYFRRETGLVRENGHFDISEVDGNGGYEGMAISIMRAIGMNRSSHLIVNVKNEGLVKELEWDDVIEVTCVVDKNGPFSLNVNLPEDLKALVIQVKSYERLTVEAAVERSYWKALKALTLNPLVNSIGKCRSLLNDYNKQHNLQLI